MRTELTHAEIESYRQNGFLRIPDFLDPDELDHWRQVIDEAVLRRSTRVPGGDPDDPKSFGARVFIQRQHLGSDNPDVARLVRDPRLGKLIAQLEGLPAVRFYHDQALFKDPGSNATSWHLDVPFWSADTAQAVTIWVALDDSTLQNGCLHFLPGTHRTEDFQSTEITPDMGHFFKIRPECREIEPVAVPLPAGGCTFHNGLTAHAAGPNMTRTRRRAMTISFMPEAIRFNGKPDTIAPERLATMQVGQPLDDPLFYPVIYRG
ncbi:MAG TPA: phytanoyl-CoA dioxygenase family protein [Candidatus Sumerlaeota bacterium]|nr:phytanoyl-CoA dioxygenase family protein [Candidatus Sumerlaeota bacterium]HOR28903.1 phytanoyl-CoA dioxygenase family protein [Candidatus Sumerlaeota bacterium]HPK01645.1 phytanoyl-CoA dioxygenase family protein [Candidatus Sumerlaeota bacterium]